MDDDDDDVYDNDHDNTNYRQPNDNDDDHNAAADEEVLDEYASAKKLVQRAADREALLKLFTKRPTTSTSSSVDAAAKNEASGITASSSTSFVVGDNNGSDFSSLPLKSDHISRPCWTCPNGTIYLEAFHPLYVTAYDFLVAISEPIRRPEYIHEYQLTPYSLYAAVATNIDTESIVKTLNRFSKNVLPMDVATFIRECTKRYGKAKLVLKHNRYYVESDYPEVLRELLRDEAISQARVLVVEGEDSPTTTAVAAASAAAAGGSGGGNQIIGGKTVGATGAATNVMNADGFIVHTKAQEMEENLRMLHELDGNGTDDDDDEEDYDDDDDDGGDDDKNDSAIGDTEGRAGGGSSLSSPKRKKTARHISKTTVSFQIKGDSVEIVKRRAIE
jgi:DNA excision repair protein ERCC-3